MVVKWLVKGVVSTLGFKLGSYEHIYSTVFENEIYMEMIIMEMIIMI